MRQRILTLFLPLLAITCDSTPNKPVDTGTHDISAGLDKGVADATVDGSTRLDLALDHHLRDMPAPDAAAACRLTLVPGPCASGHETSLAALALDYERSFHVISAHPTGVNATLSVTDPAHRKLLVDFLQQTKSWDFAAYASRAIDTVVSAWHKAAGLYSGVGIAADAFRYAVLRDEDAPSDEIARARRHLLAAMDALHLASAITGRKGSIARGFQRTDMPGTTPPTVALFNAKGEPLPTEKNNGTWREDNSGGSYPNYVWEDSCSRDQLLGWIAAYGAIWEVIHDDTTIDDALKQRLRKDATDLARGLAQPGPTGIDLTLVDGDGRPTYHGFIHEDCFDRICIPNPFVKNGGNALMALGTITTLAYVAGDSKLDTYLRQELIGKRGLHQAASNFMLLDAGPKTNFSNYNMVFTAAWLVIRYSDSPPVRQTITRMLKDNAYGKAIGLIPQPHTWGYALFDLVYATARRDSSLFGKRDGPLETQAIERATTTLGAFPRPPFFGKTVEHCDASELEDGRCLAEDGITQIILQPLEDRSGDPWSITPLPIQLLPSSDYTWRSSPFRVNGGIDPSQLIPGVDFRFAYWIGRRVRR